jgi:hypothetical protein
MFTYIEGVLEAKNYVYPSCGPIFCVIFLIIC